MQLYDNSRINYNKFKNLTTVKNYRVYTERQLDTIPQIARMSTTQRKAMHVVAKVLPFRVNQYVIDELIDWDNIPDDPIFQLTFPQKDMLAPEEFNKIATLIDSQADAACLQDAIKIVREQLNPHPASQQSLNVPHLDGEHLDGMQHKYRETVLFFPGQGQTCHAYCTFCFRWAQFVGDKTLRIAANESTLLHRYLQQHQEVTDLLITGGDPMIMKTRHLASYLEPLLAPDFEHLQTLRIGTKALSYWPHRFVLDDDADALLRLLEKMVRAGKHISIMAHYNHWRELDTPIAREAIRKLRETGVIIRSQSPLVAHINDDSEVWARMWKDQVRQSIVPYYMFVERNTGARRYFEVPLVKALEIYRTAIQQVSGMGRTARGPSMSAGPGKVEIQGIAKIKGEQVFVLRFIQSRNPDWAQRPFFARYDAQATWLDDLHPAFEEQKFFFQDEYNSILHSTNELLLN